MSKHGKVYRQLYLYEMAFTSQEVTMEEMIKKLGDGVGIPCEILLRKGITCVREELQRCFALRYLYLVWQGVQHLLKSL